MFIFRELLDCNEISLEVWPLIFQYFHATLDNLNEFSSEIFDYINEKIFKLDETLQNSKFIRKTLLIFRKKDEKTCENQQVSQFWREIKGKLQFKVLGLVQKCNNF